jgi:Na+-translocating ferredoxin:NAD+ oxidoreductase RnfD subunit
MKTPTWGTVIGIMMIVFGGCGALHDIKAISTPQKLKEEQQKIRIRIAEKNGAKNDTSAVATITEFDGDSTVRVDIDSADAETKEVDIPFFGKKSPDEILQLSEFSATWIVRFGFIGAAISIIYLLGGVFLLNRRTFSIKLVYAALVLSMLCAGAQTAILTSNATGDLIAIGTGLGQLPGILIDIILLAVVFSSEKDAYKEENLSR